MTLKEHIEKLAPETHIRIGAKNGSGWFYFGTVGEIDWAELDDIAFKQNHPRTPKQEFVSVKDREVVDEPFPSIRDSKTIHFLVEGRETSNLVEKTTDAFSGKDILKSQEGMERLAIAIMTDVADQLRNIYVDVREAKNHYLACLQDAATTEDWIRKNLISCLIAKSPQRIIAELRKEIFGEDEE